MGTRPTDLTEWRAGRQQQPTAPPQARLLPFSQEAEEAVLALALFRPDTIVDAAPVVKPADFSPRNGHIWHAILEVCAADQPVDVITVSERLTRQGLIGTVGGVARLLDLMAGAPSTQNAAVYAEIIAGYALRRRQIEQLDQLTETLYGGGKIDLDLIERAPAPFLVQPVYQCLVEPPPEPRQLVAGLFRAGEIVCVAAPRAIGKSWFGMQLAADLAQGHTKFLGRFWIGEPSKVLYLHFETDERGASSRWKGLFGGDGLIPANLLQSFARPTVRIVQVERRDGVETRREWRAELDHRLVAWVESERPDVIILDPWAAFFGGESNSNDQVQAAFKTLRPLCEKFGLAIVLIHHISGLKQSGTRTLEPEDLWRGATSLADAVAVRVTLLPHHTPATAKKAGLDAPSARRYVDVSFQSRNDREPAPMSLHRGNDNRWRDWEPETPGPDDDEEVGPSRSESLRADRRVLLGRALQKEGGVLASIRTAEAAAGCTYSVMDKAIKEGLSDGVIVRRLPSGYESGVDRSWWHK